MRGLLANEGFCRAVHDVRGMIGIEEHFTIAPPDWPSRANVPPGDLTRFAPIGLGMSAPMVVMPWDDLGNVLSRGSFYGANARTGNPFEDAPVNDAAGGVLYFDSPVELGSLGAVFKLLHIDLTTTAYALFAAESTDTKKERYLAQIRIVLFSAMKLFGAIPNESGNPPLQTLPTGAAIKAFLDAQEARWGSGMSDKLEGTLGGDGDWAQEKLSFGFMVENASNGVYRLWSRPWLVTK